MQEIYDTGEFQYDTNSALQLARACHPPNDIDQRMELADALLDNAQVVSVRLNVKNEICYHVVFSPQNLDDAFEFLHKQPLKSCLLFTYSTPPNGWAGSIALWAATRPSCKALMAHVFLAPEFEARLKMHVFYDALQKRDGDTAVGHNILSFLG